MNSLYLKVRGVCLAMVFTLCVYIMIGGCLPGKANADTAGKASAAAKQGSTAGITDKNTSVVNSAAKSTANPAAYTRFTDMGNGIYAMQLAMRTFAPAKGRGPRVVLASAVHIGSKAYYARLQQILDSSKLVLYEGVSDDPEAFRRRSTAREATARDESGSEASSGALYDHLAAAAGLISQGHGINYDRTHFRNADLSMREMRERLEAETRQGGKTASEANEALQLMREAESMLRGTGGFSLLIARGIGSFVASSPALRTLLLYQIATIEDKQEEFLSGLWVRVPPGLRRLERMILQERNDAVLDSFGKVLKQRRHPATIAIFYGAAHMRGIEEGLVKKHGYRLRETEWVTAFTLNPAAAGLPSVTLAAIARRAKSAQKITGH